MKRLAILLAATAIAGPAFAADLITEEPPAPAPVVVDDYNWTGLYLGGQAGIAFGGSDGAVGLLGGMPVPFDGSGTFTDNTDIGFTGGVHVGYDYQLPNNVIIGGVADFNYIDHDRSVGAVLGQADINGDGFADVGENAGISNDIDINFFGTVRGKVGYAMDRFAVYATGGLAYADIDNDLNGTGSFTSVNGTNYSSVSDKDKDSIGYTVGGGVDFLATKNISFGLEYLYTDLGKAKTSTTFDADPATIAGGDPASFGVETKTDLDFHTVMAKASYRFN
jgi:outer membrane immunogenic protein